jgi:hypothetical protein
MDSTAEESRPAANAPVFITLPLKVFKDRRLRADHYRFMALYGLACRGSSYTKIPYAEIAKRLRCSLDRVYKIADDLSAWGHITVVKTRNRDSVVHEPITTRLQ